MTKKQDRTKEKICKNLPKLDQTRGSQKVSKFKENLFRVAFKKIFLFFFLSFSCFFKATNTQQTTHFLLAFLHHP